jgi:hypothetical protein
MLVLLASQWCLSLAEGRGIDAMRDRGVYTGHAEFIRLGSTRKMSPGEVLEHYEELHGRNARYLPSKPPGQMLAYMGLSRIADAVMPAEPRPATLGKLVRDDANWRLLNLVTFVLPFGAALAAALIVPLTRKLAPPTSTVAVAAGLALTAPIVLITLHFDQAVYPFLTIGWLICAAYGGASSRRSWVWGLALGVLTWAGLFVSFSLLGALPLTLAAFWTMTQGVPWSERGRRLRGIVLGGAIGFIVPSVLLFLVWHYNPFVRYQHAMAYHAAWKRWDPTLRNIVILGILDLVEFAWSVGPVIGPAIVAMVAGTIRIWQRRPSGLDVFAAALGPTFFVLAFFGRTAAETARLWMFLLPAILLVGVNALQTADPRGSRWAGVLLFAQASWTIVIKAYQELG